MALSNVRAVHVCCVLLCCRRAGDLFGQRNILLKAKAVLTRGLAGVDNVYTQVWGSSRHCRQLPR